MNPSRSGRDWEARLAERMAALGVRQSDLEETFVRASGPGGQNVNKLASCVVLRHRPTGLQVRCQASRQQASNRWLARQWLLDKLEAARKAREAAERARREKLRRQTRKPGPRAQQRRLAEKARRSALKAQRRGRWAE